MNGCLQSVRAKARPAVTDRCEWRSQMPGKTWSATFGPRHPHCLASVPVMPHENVRKRQGMRRTPSGKRTGALLTNSNVMNSNLRFTLKRKPFIQSILPLSSHREVSVFCHSSWRNLFVLKSSSENWPLTKDLNWTFRSGRVGMVSKTFGITRRDKNLNTIKINILMISKNKTKKS